jgi:hypothetical protein
MLGKEMTVPCSSYNGGIRLDVRGLRAGVYILGFERGGRTGAVRFTIAE